MEITCAHCGLKSDKKAAYVNRAIKIGAPQFCNKTCFGLSRRDYKSTEQKIKEKANYDRLYREKNADKLKAAKEIYNQTSAGRAVQKRTRDNRKEQHKEYIKTESYRKWKQQYDQMYNAKKHFGDFWEASILLERLADKIDNREAVKHKGTLGKTTKRKRAWLRTKKQNLPPLP